MVPSAIIEKLEYSLISRDYILFLSGYVLHTFVYQYGVEWYKAETFLIRQNYYRKLDQSHMHTDYNLANSDAVFDP